MEGLAYPDKAVTCHFFEYLMIVETPRASWWHEPAWPTAPRLGPLVTPGMQRLAPIYFDFPGLRPGTFGSYALAFLSVGVATALRFAIDPYVAGVQFITFFPAAIITTLISGFGAGVFCTLLSAAAVDFFFIEPRFAFYPSRRSEVIAILLFIVVSLVVVTLITTMRFAIERYRDQSEALHESQDRLGSVVAELQHPEPH